MKINKNLNSITIAIIAVLYSEILPATTVNKGHELAVNASLTYNGHRQDSRLIIGGSCDVSTTLPSVCGGNTTGIADVIDEGIPYVGDDGAIGINNNIESNMHLLSS